MILGLDHLQVSIPAGRLPEALQFYVGFLGFNHVPKPASLDPQGAWLEQGGVSLHLGEEAPFATDGRAHPAYRVDDMDTALEPVIREGFSYRFDAGPDGFRRASVFDPFGNRIEFMQKLEAFP